MNHEAPTAKKTFEGSLHHNNVHFAISTMRGKRPNQEDTYLIQTELQVDDSPAQVLPKHSLFAVFDGHGTSFASHYASEHFVSIFSSQPAFVEYSSIYLKKMSSKAAKECSLESDKEMLLLQSAVRTTMLTLDAKILEEMTSIENDNGESALAEGSFDISDAGTTAIIVILTPTHVICANLGDSRAILQRDEGNLQATISLSTDHKPDNEVEKSRILKAGELS
jgi:serine/threonine protein phosphatase PrpC